MINNLEEFRMAMQSYHLDKPKLSQELEDSLSYDLKELWKGMDDSILKFIWKLNGESSKKARSKK